MRSEISRRATSDMGGLTSKHSWRIVSNEVPNVSISGRRTWTPAATFLKIKTFSRDMSEGTNGACVVNKQSCLADALLAPLRFPFAVGRSINREINLTRHCGLKWDSGSSNKNRVLA